MITIIIIIIGNINSYYNNNKLRYHMKSSASQILNDSLSLCYTIFQLIITICFFNVLRFHLDVTSSHLILARPWWERVLTQNSYSVSIATNHHKYVVLVNVSLNHFFIFIENN